MPQFVKNENGWSYRSTWYITEIDPDTGKKVRKRKSKYVTGFATKRQAAIAASEFETRRNTGENILENPALFDYAEDYIELNVKNRVRPATLIAYQNSIKRIEDNFPNIPLKSITRSMFQAFLNQISIKYSKSTVNQTAVVFSQIMKLALADGIIVRDVTSFVQIPEKAQDKRKIDYLSLSDVKALVQHIKSNLSTSKVCPYFILTAIQTGARLSEIAALTWNDLTPISIKITKQRNRDGVVSKPKTESSVRTVSITKELYNILQDLRVNKKDLIFEQPNGIVPDPSSLNFTLRRLLKECGIERHGFHFHSLRHTHVALLLNADVDILTISQRLGHKNVSTTTEVYAYLLDEKKKSEERKIKSVLETM